MIIRTLETTIWRLSFAVALIVAGFGPCVAARGGQPAANPVAEKLRVAAVQMRSTRDLEANIQKIDEHLVRCAKENVDVAVFPECALTGYFDNDFMWAITKDRLDDAEGRVAESCRKNHIHAIVGMPYRDGERLYNSATVITPQGDVLARYHKVQLAESWPVAGDKLVVFKINGVPASIIICHDERYPELVRLPVLAGSRLVFCLSHESGLEKESKIAPYRAQIQARAVENSVYVVQANAPANTDSTGSHGQSRLVAPDGNLIQEASMLGEDTISADLDMGKSTGRLAQQSINRGPLGEWWRAGVSRVRIIGDRIASEKEPGN